MNVAAAVESFALKAAGAIVYVAPEEFIAIRKRADSPVVLVAQGGVLKKHYRYLTSYKGLAFFAKSDVALVLPPRVEAFAAKKIWVPEF